MNQEEIDKAYYEAGTKWRWIPITSAGALILAAAFWSTFAT